MENPGTDRVRLKRKTLQSVMEQCQRALELLATTSGVDGGGDDEEDDDGDGDGGTRGESSASGSLRGSDREADEV